MDEDAAPRKPATEAHHEDQFPRLDDAAAQVLIQGKPHGSSGGVAVPVEIEKKLLLGDSGLLEDEVDDPDICLVRDDVVELFRRYPRLGGPPR